MLSGKERAAIRKAVAILIEEYNWNEALIDEIVSEYENRNMDAELVKENYAQVKALALKLLMSAFKKSM